MIVHGHLGGLRASQVQGLERFYRRRLPADQVLTPELARELAERSFELKRQIGLIVDRLGTVRHVIVGDDRQIVIPDLSSLSLGRSRLRGVRCLHTHLRNEPLSRDDLTDLALLRLDLMLALQVTPEGLPGRIDYAHLLPATAGDKGVEVVSVPSITAVPRTASRCVAVMFPLTCPSTSTLLPMISPMTTDPAARVRVARSSTRIDPSRRPALATWLNCTSGPLTRISSGADHCSRSALRNRNNRAEALPYNSPLGCG